MLAKYAELERVYNNIESDMGNPEIASNPAKYQELAKKYSELTAPIRSYRAYTKITAELADLEAMKTDPELLELAEIEIPNLKKQQEQLASQLQTLLIPPDPLDRLNAYLEVRAGTGGEEAALFAGDIFRMYVRYAEKRGWQVELIDENSTGIGGYKEVVAKITGEGVFSRLKFESGIHRVQRVPATESSGRIHTSAATVAFMPEVTSIEIVIEEKDLKVDTYRASGAGGQHINKTSSAIRITHLPTGVVVTCQESRSQHKNKAQAMEYLRARLYEAQLEKQQTEHAQKRKLQVGSGDRSEKIRTYNFPERRVTDHRIKLTLHRLESILDGDIDELLDALIAEDQLSKLQEMEEREER